MADLHTLEQSFTTAAGRALLGMREALNPFTETETFDFMEGPDPAPPKFWPSGIPYIDSQVGGYYGLAAIAADKKVGKSTQGLISACKAAATGEWQVVYLAAEDDYDAMAERFNRYMHNHPDDYSGVENGLLTFLSIGRGQTPATLTKDIAHSIDYNKDIPVLTILDSVNSIVNLSGKPYLQGITDLGLWMAFSRKISRGDASFLAICETNKRGEAKGEGIGYWADLYMTMRRPGNDDSTKRQVPGLLKMDLKATRRTAFEGDMGWYYRDSEKVEFIPEDQLGQQLYVVGGEDIL